jgi:hypothetical protein
LLPIEQIAIGGIDAVRGYRENQLVARQRLPCPQVLGADQRALRLGRMVDPDRLAALDAADVLRRPTPRAVKDDLRRLQADAFGLGMEHELNNRLDSLEPCVLRDLSELADGIALFLRVAARIA